MNAHQSMRMCSIVKITIFYDYKPINPFHICGNAAKLEDKTKGIFASVKQSYCSVQLQIGCIPTDVKGVYTFVLGKSPGAQRNVGFFFS